jgi:hypothetical protein
MNEVCEVEPCGAGAGSIEMLHSYRDSDRPRSHGRPSVLLRVARTEVLPAQSTFSGELARLEAVGPAAVDTKPKVRRSLDQDRRLAGRGVGDSLDDVARRQTEESRTDSGYAHVAQTSAGNAPTGAAPMGHPVVCCLSRPPATGLRRCPPAFGVRLRRPVRAGRPIDAHPQRASPCRGGLGRRRDHQPDNPRSRGGGCTTSDKRSGCCRVPPPRS